MRPLAEASLAEKGRFSNNSVYVIVLKIRSDVQVPS